MNSKALWKIGYGMYIVGARAGGRSNGQIANTVFQVTSEPATIAVSINKTNLTCDMIKASGAFSVSVLSKDTGLEFIGRFGFRSGREYDKFSGVRAVIGASGAPVVLENAVAYYEAKVVNSVDAGTHMLFIGQIVACETLNDSVEPMTYAFYHTVKQGTAPKTAPTYISEEKKETGEGTAMKKYRCSVCGYVYDPEKGDPDNGVKPGTSFEQIPDSWVCPVCGAPKSAFEPA